MEKKPILDSPKFHKIWVKQCVAAEHIKLRYGSKAAFDYIVAEKLFNFADAATAHPEFARELPRFVARVRGLFTAEEIRADLNRIELEQREYDANINDRCTAWDVLNLDGATLDALTDLGCTTSKC